MMPKTYLDIAKYYIDRICYVQAGAYALIDIAVSLRKLAEAFSEVSLDLDAWAAAAAGEEGNE